MRSYLRFIERFWLLIVLVMSLATGYFAWQLGSLAVDSNPYLLPENHPARAPLFEIQKKFTGTWDAVLLAIESDSTVFTPANLRAIRSFTEQSRRIGLVASDDSLALVKIASASNCPAELKTALDEILQGGVGKSVYYTSLRADSLASVSGLSRAERSFLQYLPRRIKPIKDVASISGTRNILAEEGSLISRSSVEDSATADSTDKVRKEIMGNSLMVGSVVTKDQKIALIAIELHLKQDDADGQLRAYDKFEKMVREYQAAHPEFKAKVHIAGVPIFIAEQKKLMDRDFGLLFPLVTLVVGLMLVVFFRKPMGVLLPILNVVMCTIWTLGIMSLTRVPMDLITSALPVFLITICGADAIHMMVEYYHQRSLTPDRFEAVFETMKEMASPVVLTTITSVVGFLVSTSVDISSMKTFGWFMAVGLVSAQVISLILLPALLIKVSYKFVAPVSHGESDHAAPGWVERAFVVLCRRRSLAIAVLAVVFAVALGFATRIQVEDKGAEYFAKDNTFRLSDEFINDHIAGTSPGWLAFETTDGESILTPGKLAFLNRVDSFLRAQPHVTYNYSLPKYVDRMNLVLHDMDPVYDAIPGMEMKIPGGTLLGKDSAPVPQVESSSEVQAKIRQVVLMYENGGGTDLTNVLSKDQRSAATMFTMNTSIASDYNHLLQTLNDWLAVNMPKDLKKTLGGAPVIWSGVLDEIMTGQVQGVLMGFLAVLAALALWLRSIKAGFLASLPLLSSMVFFFAFMAAFGIDLNIGTSIIAFLLIGIVDYSVHFLLRVKGEVDQGKSVDQAIPAAVRSSGRSIMFNIAIFSIGFLCLLFSDFAPIRILGGLVSMALLMNGILSMVLISLFYPWLGPKAKKVAA